MKLFCFAFLLSFSLLFETQASSDLLIFNADGNVALTRDNISIEKLQGEKLLEGDILNISDGNITLINLNNKRITIDKPGNYTYKDVSLLMQKAEASLTNRYFIFVWKKMNTENKQVNKPGGVVRGEGIETYPFDSAIVLSDSIEFLVTNRPDIEYSLIIKSEKFKVLDQYEISNSLVIATSDFDDGNTGKYYWQIEAQFEKGPKMKCFFIPDAETKKILLAEYLQAVDEFGGFDNDLQKLLLQEYMISNRIYVR